MLSTAYFRRFLIQSMQQKNRSNFRTLKTAQYSQPQNSQWGEVWSFLQSLTFLIVIAFFLRATVVEAFKIPSSSMEPTLVQGDHILVNKLSYGLQVPLLNESLFVYAKPSRGDVVVFTLPDDAATPEVDESETNIIKRVIGLQGDTVEVRGPFIYINGEIFDEQHYQHQWVFGGAHNFGPVTIPPGRVLLLGDNRDQSRDSRFWPDPFVELERIKGRAFVIYWNLSSISRALHLIR